jgi:hypothetical protein
VVRLGTADVDDLVGCAPNPADTGTGAVSMSTVLSWYKRLFVVWVVPGGLAAYLAPGFFVPMGPELAAADTDDHT